MAAKKGFFGKSYPGLDAKQKFGYSKEEAARMAAADAEKLARNRASTAAISKRDRLIAVQASKLNSELNAARGIRSGFSKMLKAGVKGVLSPAGLAEGVAGATVKAMRDSGVPMTPEDAIRKGKLKPGKGVPGKSRRGERA